MNNVHIGIIGGSGLYNMRDLTDIEEIKIETPFGPPSDNFIVGTLSKKRVAFLPRHGRGHLFTPTEINYRANIFGFKKLGIRQIISVSAVGSLKLEHKPLDIILPDQFVDITRHRVSTFFEDGIVAHVPMGNPVCHGLMDFISHGASNADIQVKKGGTYICMEGPAFSTRAESNIYRSWGMDVIGMTNAQEAKLAREAEICYASIALVTDYDCWHEEESSVSAEMVIENINKNNENAQKILKEILKLLPEERECECQNSLANAIVTQPDMIPANVKEKLSIIIGRYMPSKEKEE